MGLRMVMARRLRRMKWRKLRKSSNIGQEKGKPGRRLTEILKDICWILVSPEKILRRRLALSRILMMLEMHMIIYERDTVGHRLAVADI